MSFIRIVVCITVVAVALPSLAATNLNSSRSNVPITSSYNEESCKADGGKVEKDGDKKTCALAKTIIKSKSNITNN